MEPVGLPQFSALSVCGGILASLLARQRSCAAAVNFSDLLYLLDGLVGVRHLWQLQRSLHLVVDPVDILHLMNLVSLHTESGES